MTEQRDETVTGKGQHQQSSEGQPLPRHGRRDDDEHGSRGRGQREKQGVVVGRAKRGARERHAGESGGRPPGRDDRGVRVPLHEPYIGAITPTT